MMELRTENLVVGYDKHPLIKNVNLRVKSGEVLTLIGPNGAGKSTAFSMITRLMKRDGGQVFIEGKELDSWDKKELSKKIAILKQSNNINIRLTIRELVSFGRFPYCEGKLQADDIKYVEEAIEYMRLTDIQDKYLDELSGGQRQRLLLAATLAVHPEIIVLDEPVSAMDPDGAQALYKLVYDIHKRYGTTIVVVEHRTDFLLPYVTDMIVLKDGELVASDTFEAAAPKMYEDTTLRPLLPTLWQIKLGLQEKLGLDLGDWRSENDALADFKTFNLGASEGGNA